MLGRFAVPLFLLLLAKEFRSADGYAFPIRNGSFVTACVSDETPLAFVKDYQSILDDTAVDVVDLNGNAIPLSHLDCNLVRDGGCNKWTLNGWEEQRNMRGSFPMVTDYRWNDLPGIFANEMFEKKIDITKNQNTKMYFSVLANDSAQFLFTSDSTLDSGCNAVIDGWQSKHTSVLRNCSKINVPLDEFNYSWPTCEGAYRSEIGHDVFQEGKKWAHVTLHITFDEPDGSDSLTIGENIDIKFSAQSLCSKGKNDSDFYVSFRGTKSKRSLFKSHNYSILRPNTSSSSMEVILEEDSTSSFCVDVVFLINESNTSVDKIFSVKLLDARVSKKFEETVNSTDKYLKWTTVRFGNRDITPKKGWKLELTAHDESLVIGGVKFCKEGDLVTKTKMINATNCYPLMKRAEKQISDKTDYNKLLKQLGECKVSGGKCDGHKLCYSQNDCTCFAGYQGEYCTSCQKQKFGINCAENSKKHCHGNKYNHFDGNCLKRCANGYQGPLCESVCTGKRFGKNCSRTSERFCLNQNYSAADGTCPEGCADGYISPFCKQECQNKTYGKNCTMNSNRYCSKIDHVSGNCLTICDVGYQPPECEKACEGGKFGQNCSSKSTKHCSEGKLNHVDGTCEKGCKVGYQPPSCEKECEGKKFGQNCNSTSKNHCFGEIFNHIDGTCEKGCKVGYQPPLCDKECSEKRFGQNCSETSPQVCLDGKYSPINGRCTEGCADGYKSPNCTEECQSGKYGRNCAFTSKKHCLENASNHVDGNCLKGCAIGYQLPKCDEECTGDKYGQDCSETSNRTCLNGLLNRIDGTCLQGCAAGFKEPHCTQSCQGKSFGLNCSSVSTKKCSGDKINHVDGNCLNGCAVGFLPPKCETVLDYHGTDKNLFEIRHGNKLEACVSDSPTIAFVQNTQTTMTDFMKVKVEDLYGDDIPLSKYDCNLAVENGCKSWKQTGWEKKLNTYYDFPMVTDYRWNDLPVFLAWKSFDKKISFTSHQNLKMHFSILATDSAQFLFTKDKKFDTGFITVLDGWSTNHTSVLRYCTNILRGKYPTPVNEYQPTLGKDLLSGGMKWAHARLAITFNTTNIDYEDKLTVNDIAEINFFPKRESKITGYYVSFRTNTNSLFKLHEYHVLRSLKSTSSMELTLHEPSNAFCVDVVYLSDKKSHGDADMFSLELKDEKGASKYKESAASKDHLEWTTARFRSGDIKLGYNWKLTLTAHVKSVGIGGVRFCKEGELVFKPKVGNPTSCHSLAKNARDAKVAIPILDKQFNELLYTLSESKSLKGGYKVCKEKNTNCKCFAGFEEPGCKSCKGNRYGIGCSNTTRKHCSENKINQRSGICLEGCATGYYSPECEKQCTNKTYGKNCKETYNRFCSNGNFSHITGHCLQGCVIGFYAPGCLKGCAGRKYGMNCSQTSDRFCLNEKFSPINGTCTDGCELGYYERECLKRCTGETFGKNCSEKSPRFCLNGNYSNIDGTCLEGCGTGYLHPNCTEECTGKRFGFNCSEISDRTCEKEEHFSNNGSCQLGCAKGYTFPDCFEKIPTVTPQYTNFSFEEITLDLTTGLKGEENVLKIWIQYKENSTSQWTNASEGYILNGQEEFIISHLKPKTEYNVSLNVQEVNITMFSVSLNVSEAGKEELCTPDSLIVTYIDDKNIMDEALERIDFEKSVDNCKCGEHKISLIFKDFTLYQKYTCMNCPPPSNYGQQHNAYSVTITILAMLTALGVGVYYKRRRNQAPTNADMSSAEIYPLSAISQGESASAERPIMSNTQEIEQCLLSALANTVLLEQLFDKYPRGQTQHWDYGVKPENKKKNRYGNLAAYDSSRVKLELVPGDENSDYINANYIDGFERPKAYIATQGPRVNTLDDFWRMVWQEKVPLIVMVTNLLEGGKNKCEKYWPDNNQQATHGRVTVGTVDKEVNADYVSRVLSVSCNNANRLVQHLHYTVWPDHGVPLYPQSMAVFVEKIAEKNYVHPILVHCSAGVGRTGTVILIDACLRMIRTHGRLDVENIFAKMRSQRANLVDNLKQFEFAHLVLLECVATPNFAIGCANFTEEYNKLTSNNNEKLKESYAKLSEICERDFQRTETLAKNENDKCRYPNVFSSSNSIVRLFPYQNVVTMSFVNAVTVDGYKKPKQFVATQVPMKNTVADFWRMVDQFNVSEIVVLNEPHITEAQFLPTNQSRLLFGEIEVFFDDVQECNSVKISDVTLKRKTKSKKLSVKCASFGWMPGDLSPPNVGSLIDLWDNLKTTGEKECIAIVCHDGVTASGLFLGMGFVIEKIKLEQKVDVGLAIQFGLLYEAAKHYLCSFDTYGNFK
ncbi:Hypothetical predicted protein [Cloeon dipterum]|uniref:protein-tyrosine-phosphatase n=1 Tax=Cloeon dipterum TaxID=197152 RepID=A0A8S1CKE3_9INSE|nr:Hypothetical predicted protein [Cloeon dipterum]